jgi:hypothetical protein
VTTGRAVATFGPVQARERGLLAIACGLLAAIVLGAPASAGATVRFASPTGMNTGACGTTVTACTLQRAVEVVAVDGDEVIVLPGTYPEGADDLMVTGSKYVHGSAGAVPSITFTSPAGQGVLLSGTSVLERLAISTASSATDPAALRVTGGTAQQLTVRQDDAGNEACLVEGSALLRDSVCWANAATGIGLMALASAQPVAAVLRNVTIEATVGPARGLLANADSGGNLQLDAKNVIARGSAPAADVEASALDVTSNVTVALERSNYATESEVAMGGTQSITNPGTNSNQTATPILVNRAAGNFHQQTGSPTVDAGDSFPLIGPLDLDGDPRSVEGTAGCLAGIVRPDIGADELIPASRDCLSPETGIVRGPKRKTRKHRAPFEFTSTEAGSFQCSLDEKPFASCVSPHLYRKLRTGKHVFNVRAIDLAGNLDASPATRMWRIRAKPKRQRRSGRRPGK